MCQAKLLRRAAQSLRTAAIRPEKVGNVRRILISDQAGKSNVLHKAVKYGLNLQPDDPAMSRIIRELKELENQGFQYEGAEASFELLMRRAMGLEQQFFTVESFRVMGSKRLTDTDSLTEATVRLRVNGKEEHTASLGDGPVNALDKAMRKALLCFYPRLEEMELVDYKMRVLSGEHGTGAKVRVLNKAEKLTVGKAAQIAGLSRLQFETALAGHEIPVSNLTADEVLDDIGQLLSGILSYGA